MAVASAPVAGADTKRNAFYAGASVSQEALKNDFHKTTDNREVEGGIINVPEDPAMVFSSSGMVFSDTDTDTGYGFGAGAVAGYRFYASPQIYIAAETDITFHGGRVRGYFEGSGADGAAFHRRSGENWPENWTVSRDWSAGFTVKIGAHPLFIEKLLGAGASVYALGGARWIAGDLEASSGGCSNADLDGGGVRIVDCFNESTMDPHPHPEDPDTPIEAFNSRQELDAWAWSAGGGVSKQAGANTSVSFDVSYTGYRRQSWSSLVDNLSVRVNQWVDGGAIRSALTVTRHF